VALAGGASFTSDDAIVYQEGMIWSPDGCRPFCDDAQGTVPADGAAVVCLVSESFYRTWKDRKQLNEYCKVEGVAVNNDGRRKSGFCQPSLTGQVEVMKSALADAGVAPNEVFFFFFFSC
jgi:acyl transferase domain-containing protein